MHTQSKGLPNYLQRQGAALPFILKDAVAMVTSGKSYSTEVIWRSLCGTSSALVKYT